MKKHILILLMLCSIISSLLAQQQLTGKIIDSKNKKPIPFAALIPTNHSQYGVVTDINGMFTITIPVKAKSINIKHVSYNDKVINVSDLKKDNIIKLSPSNFKINEILVRAKDNPAHRIIRLAVANKKKHNPDNIDFYACDIYHKTTIGLEVEDSLLQNKHRRRLKGISDSMYFYLMETHVLKNYKKGKGAKERIEAIHVAGFKKPEFFLSNTEIQPFHMYDDYISINEKDFLSPLTNQSIGKYYYEITDTLYTNNDTVFSIFFRPYKNRAFDGLTGQLQINTNGYAIQNISAKPSGLHLHEISIHQQYIFTDGKWFPDEVNFDWLLPLPGSSELGLWERMSGRSKMTNIRFIEQKDIDFKIDNFAYEFTPKAWDKDSTYWDAYRIDSIVFKDRNTYEQIDSISEKINLERKMKWAATLVGSNQIQIKYISLDIKNMFTYNLYEGMGLGFAAYTNDDIASWFSTGGYIRYGINDKEIKYGGELKLIFNKAKFFNFKMGYKNDISEPGFNNYEQKTLSLFSRKMLMNRADSTIDYSASIQRQTGQFLLKFEAKTQEISPLYDYKYMPDSNLSTFVNNQVRFSVRFTPNEKFSLFYGMPISVPSTPSYSLQFIKGFKDGAGNGYNYQKILFSVIHQFNITGVGKSKLQFKSGLMFGDVPLFGLFEGGGSNEDKLPFIFNGYFQTMSVGEFYNDKYVSLFYSHNFGPIIKITKKIKPSLILSNSIGYGGLAKSENHKNMIIQPMNKGYFESGITINEMLKLNYLNLVYFGFGAGVFYKYGEYASVYEKDNFAYKISISATW